MSIRSDNPIITSHNITSHHITPHHNLLFALSLFTLSPTKLSHRHPQSSHHNTIRSDNPIIVPIENKVVRRNRVVWLSLGKPLTNPPPLPSPAVQCNDDNRSESPIIVKEKHVLQRNRVVWLSLGDTIIYTLSRLVSSIIYIIPYPILST